MWILRLNDMRSPRIEIMSNAARAESLKDLQALVERETVQPYRGDDGWGKAFRKGGPLEWFNPLRLREGELTGVWGGYVDVEHEFRGVYEAPARG